MRKSRSIKLIAALLTVAMLFTVLVGCSKKEADPTPTPSTEAPATPDDTTTAAPAALKPLKIGIIGAGCELHFYTAEKLGLYEAAGYDVELVHVNPAEQQMLIETGKIDVTDGVLDFWLKPIENGLDIKATIGIQQGCFAVVVREDSPYKTIADLKGKKIGTTHTSGVGEYFWRLLLADGYDPENDFEWVVLESAATQAALDSGEVDAISVGDSGIYPRVQSGELRFVAQMSTDPQIADETCCLLVFSSQYVKSNLEDVKAITQVLYDASIYLQSDEHKKEIVDYGFEKGLILSGEPATTYEIAKTYVWNPGFDIGIKTFTNIFKAYQGFGIISEDVSAEKVVENLFVQFDLKQ
ncbi:MAG: ABC transporter substrate-binding protein [Oscillospiraceae bacterium]|jgi:NitT/TauT family transport system substrate-binding protein|nr:ABC transporter substrate-binding protein [Oscillospiraceae bacterium]